MDNDTPAMRQYMHLCTLYNANTIDKAARQEYADTLMEYTLEIMKAATAVLLEALDLDAADVQIVDITERQRHALIASGCLDLYITGKDTVDD